MRPSLKEKHGGREADARDEFRRAVCTWHSAAVEDRASTVPGPTVLECVCRVDGGERQGCGVPTPIAAFVRSLLAGLRRQGSQDTPAGVRRQSTPLVYSASKCMILRPASPLPHVPSLAGAVNPLVRSSWVHELGGRKKKEGFTPRTRNVWGGGGIVF